MAGWGSRMIRRWLQWLYGLNSFACLEKRVVPWRPCSRGPGLLRRPSLFASRILSSRFVDSLRASLRAPPAAAQPSSFRAVSPASGWWISHAELGALPAISLRELAWAGSVSRVYRLGAAWNPPVWGRGFSSSVAGSVFGFERGRCGAELLHASRSVYPSSTAVQAGVALWAARLGAWYNWANKERPSNPSRSSGRLAQFQATAAFGCSSFGERRWPAWAARLATKRWPAAWMMCWCLVEVDVPS